MIYHNSNDPIELKKISLRLWSLRDQYESLAEEMLKQSDQNQLGGEVFQKKLKEIYQKPIIPMTALGEAETTEETTHTENSQLFVPEEKVFLGSTFLSDITMERISFFSQEYFIPGQSLVIQFVVPDQFTLHAESFFCKNYNIGSRILSSTRLKYRIFANFTFLRPGERTVLRKFVTSIQPITAEIKKVEPTPEKTPEQAPDQFQEQNNS